MAAAKAMAAPVVLLAEVPGDAVNRLVLAYGTLDEKGGVNDVDGEEAVKAGDGGGSNDALPLETERASCPCAR